MNLTDYLDTYQLLKIKPATREENRSFGLEHKGIGHASQMLAWRDKHLISIGSERIGDKFEKYLYGIDVATGVISLLLGLATGAALLSYNGSEPVNVVYFIAIAVLIPLLTMMLALWSMARSSSRRNTLVYLTPAYWLEKILSMLPGNTARQMQEIKLNPRLFNWLIIKRSQMLGLIFSLGLLTSLLVIVSTRDIAFAWSTTLHVTSEQFHSLLNYVSLPWKSLIPSAVPSLEIVEQSQYFRLGGKLNGDMLSHASMLGEWWKFLAMATLVYALLGRFVMWIISSFGFDRVIKSSLLGLEGADVLIEEMNTPVVSTTSVDSEPLFSSDDNRYGQIAHALDEKYDDIIGWSIDSDTLSAVKDSLDISGETTSAGGANSLEMDRGIISRLDQNTLLLVKSWEPPTMDFVDFISSLAGKAKKVVVVPIGIPENRYNPNAKDIAVWGSKLKGLDNSKIWLFENIRQQKG